jgi:8-oxo-dGTP pyrophosphatase MutT (NUDIX family)
VRPAPVGASVLVWRRAGNGREWLVLHRSAAGSSDEGEWVWTPPGGVRHVDESVEACARRELYEETGLELEPQRTAFGDRSWVVFLAEAPEHAEVRLDAEHDRVQWVDVDEAVTRWLPKAVGETFRKADRRLQRKGPLTRP